MKDYHVKQIDGLYYVVDKDNKICSNGFVSWITAWNECGQVISDNTPRTVYSDGLYLRGVK